MKSNKKMPCDASNGSTKVGVGKPHPDKRWHSGGTCGQWRYVNKKTINPKKKVLRWHHYVVLHSVGEQCDIDLCNHEL
jgi:hypothetical protein